MSLLDPAAAVDLVRRIAAGEDRAESELVERCGGALRFLTLRFSRDEADAEDLYQETLLVALEKIRGGEVKQPERLAAFLRALAKNLSIQRYRRRSYGAEQSSSEMPEPVDEGQEGSLGSLLQGERARAARQLLAQMEIARDREVLVRYYLREESSSRICGDLGLDGDHFYRVLHRARQRFRRLWEGSGVANGGGKG